MRKRLEEQKVHHPEQQEDRSAPAAPRRSATPALLNPEGIRIGGESKHRRAVKEWDRREFRDLDDQVELGTRNIKIALRRLRKFARTGTPTSSISTTPSRAPRTRAISTSACAPSSTSADQGAGAVRHRRVDELARQAGRGAVLRRRALQVERLVHFSFHNCLYEKSESETAAAIWRRRRPSDVLQQEFDDYKM